MGDDSSASLMAGDEVKRQRRSKRQRVSDPQPGSAAEKPAPKKRQKWLPKLGKLADLMNMPMDVLFEIFGHLRPLDLLNLARTTKQFRGVLMHKSSISIWISARESVPDLPPCPPFLSEPHYANLVFDQHCHTCLTPHIRSVDWRLGMRLCAKCAKTNLFETFLYMDEHFLTPRRPAKRGRHAFYHKHLSEVREKLSSLNGDVVELDRYKEQQSSLVKQITEHAELCEKWATSQARDRSEQLEDARRDRKRAIIEKLTELGWGEEIAQIPYRDDLSHHKLVKQPTRLTTRIWTNVRDELTKYMETMKANRLERERKDLIISRKRIAVNVLRRYKISHLPMADVMPEPADFCEFTAVQEVLEMPTEVSVTEESFDGVISNLDTIIEEWREQIHKEFAKKYKQCLEDNSRTNDLTDDDGGMLDLPPSLFQVGTSQDKGKGKGKELDFDEPIDPAVAPQIRLASTVFKCKECNPSRSFAMFDPYDDDDDFFDIAYCLSRLRHPRRSDKSNPLFYPKVMGHRCFTKQRGYMFSYPISDPTRHLESPMGSRTQWNCQTLEVDNIAGEVVKDIVQACGLDPETTTSTQMDELNPRLACTACLSWGGSTDEAEASAFGWRSAVKHNSSDHYDKTVKWLKLEGSSLQDALHYEELHNNISAVESSSFGLPSQFPSDMIVWMCAHCLDLQTEREPMELSKMKSHISVIHQLEDPEENKDYYKDYEAPQGYRTTKLPQRSTIKLAITKPETEPGSDSGHDEYPMDDFDESYLF